MVLSNVDTGFQFHILVNFCFFFLLNWSWLIKSLDFSKHFLRSNLSIWIRCFVKLREKVDLFNYFIISITKFLLSKQNLRSLFIFYKVCISRNIYDQINKCNFSFYFFMNTILKILISKFVITQITKFKYCCFNKRKLLIRRKIRVFLTLKTNCMGKLRFL